MQFAPTSGPCHGGCGTKIKYSRKPGALGLCQRCCLDATIVATARANRKAMQDYMDKEIATYGTWDPKVGGYRMAPGAFGMGKPKKARRP